MRVSMQTSPSYTNNSAFLDTLLDLLNYRIW